MSDQPTLLSFAERLATLEPREDGGQDDLIWVDQARRIGDLVRQVISTSPDDLVPPSWYANLWTEAQLFVNAVNSYQANGSVGELQNALNVRYGLLGQLAPFTVLTLPPDPERLSARATAFRQSIGQLARHLTTELDELRGQAQKQKDDFQQALGPVKQSVADLEEAVGAQKARTDAVIDGFQLQFSAGQDERAKSFLAWEKSIADDADAVLEEVRDTAASKSSVKLAELDRRNLEASEVLAELQGIREKVEGLYGAVTDKVLSGEFESEAGTQKSEADNWRKWAVLAGSVAIALAIVFLFVPVRVDTGHSLVKLGITLSIAALSAYCGKQSGLHRGREQHAKKIQLELASLSPFVRDLPGPQRHRVIEIVAGRLFTGNVQGGEFPPTVITHAEPGSPSQREATGDESNVD